MVQPVAISISAATAADQIAMARWRQLPRGWKPDQTDTVFFEIAADLGYDVPVLDVEHGTLSLADLDRLIPLARALGLQVLVKVTGPQGEAIQQALDFGAHGVVIPHIGDIGHARTVCAAAKYPLLGTRSDAGAKRVRYGVSDDAYFERDNRETLCFPMVETADALRALEGILALPTVDGVFVGASDRSLTRGRGRYRFTDADRDDLRLVARLCADVGKPWIMPAWRDAERAFAASAGAASLIVAEQQAALHDGLSAHLLSARSTGLRT